jgi:hypothetical protein
VGKPWRRRLSPQSKRRPGQAERRLRLYRLVHDIHSGSGAIGPSSIGLVVIVESWLWPILGVALNGTELLAKGGHRTGGSAECWRIIQRTGIIKRSFADGIV